MRWRAEPKAEASVKIHRGTTTTGRLTVERSDKKLGAKDSSETSAIGEQQKHLEQINIRHIPSRGQVHCVPVQRRAVVAIVAEFSSPTGDVEGSTSLRHSDARSREGPTQHAVRNEHVNSGLPQ